MTAKAKIRYVSDKRYIGERLGDDTASPVKVMVADSNGLEVYELVPDASLKVWNHSPDGFNWGYGGSGPAQLALAILLDHFNGVADATREYYQDFKWRTVASFGAHWEMTTQQIDHVLGQIREDLKIKGRHRQ